MNITPIEKQGLPIGNCSLYAACSITLETDLEYRGLQMCPSAFKTLVIDQPVRLFKILHDYKPLDISTPSHYHTFPLSQCTSVDYT